MADAVAALRAEVSASTVGFREELDKGAKAAQEFAARTGQSISAAGATAGTKLAGISASIAGLGESMRGANASVQVASKALDAFGDKLSPLAQGAATAFTQVATTGFEPLGIGIGLVTVAVAGLIAEMNKVPAATAEIAAISKQLADSANSFADAQGARRAGTTTEVAALRRLVNERQTTWAAIVDLRAQRTTAMFERRYRDLSKLTTAQMELEKKHASLIAADVALEESLARQATAFDITEGLKNADRAMESLIREWDAAAAERSAALMGEDPGVAPTIKKQVDEDLLALSELRESLQLTGAAATAGLLGESGDPLSADDRKRFEEITAAHDRSSKEIAQTVRKLNLDIRSDGLSTSEAEIARIEDETRAKLVEYEALGLSTVELEEKTQRRILQIRDEGRRDDAEKAIEATKKLSRELEQAAKDAREDLATSGFGGGFGVTLDDAAKRMTSLSLAGERAGDALANGLGDAFSSISTNAQSAGDAFEGFGKSVINTLLDIEARWAAGQLVQALGGALNLPGFNTAAASATQIGGPSTYADAVAADNYISGLAEKGPVTAARRRFRSIDTEALGEGRGGDRGLKVEYHDYGTGVKPSTERRRGPDGETIVVKLKKMIADDIDSGGEVGRSVERSYGLRRRPR